MNSVIAAAGASTMWYGRDSIEVARQECGKWSGAPSPEENYTQRPEAREYSPLSNRKWRARRC